MPCAIHAFAKDVLNLGPRLGGDQRLGRIAGESRSVQRCDHQQSVAAEQKISGAKRVYSPDHGHDGITDLSPQRRRNAAGACWARSRTARLVALSCRSRGWLGAAARCRSGRAEGQRQDGAVELVPWRMWRSLGGRRRAHAAGHSQSRRTSGRLGAEKGHCQMVAAQGRCRRRGVCRVAVRHREQEPRAGARGPLSPKAACGVAGRSAHAGARCGRCAAQCQSAGAGGCAVSARAGGHAWAAGSFERHGRFVLVALGRGSAGRGPVGRRGEPGSAGEAAGGAERGHRAGRLGCPCRAQPALSLLQSSSGAMRSGKGTQRRHRGRSTPRWLPPLRPAWHSASPTTTKAAIASCGRKACLRQPPPLPSSCERETMPRRRSGNWMPRLQAPA